MNPTVMTPDVLVNMYRWICECAESQAICPTNQDICDHYGFKSMSSAAVAIKKLETQGRIKVTRFNRARLVKIVATGKCTALPKVKNKKVPVPVLQSSITKARPNVVRKAPAGPIAAIRKGPRGRQCQWIEGEPTETDACKCLATTTSDSPYCFHHEHRAHTHAGDYIPGYMKPSLKGLGG